MTPRKRALCDAGNEKLASLFLKEMSTKDSATCTPLMDISRFLTPTLTIRVEYLL